MDLGSCQYSTIGDNLDSYFSQDLSTQMLIRKFPKISFNNVKDWDDILLDVKDELKDSVLEEDDEFFDEDDRLGQISNILTVGDFFVYACNTSWDLWSACNFIGTKLNINIIDTETQYGMYTDEVYGVILYYLYKVGLVIDTEVYVGFDT